MSILPAIIIAVIIILMIRSQKKTASGHARTPSPVRPRPSSPASARSSWNLQGWMEIAGELRCRYIRPEGRGGVPSLAGSSNGFSYEIMPDPGDALMTLYRIGFRTPCPESPEAVKKASSLFPNWARLTFRQDAVELSVPGKTPSPEVLHSLLKAAAIVHPHLDPEPQVRIPVSDLEDEDEIVYPEPAEPEPAPVEPEEAEPEEVGPAPVEPEEVEPEEIEAEEIEAERVEPVSPEVTPDILSKEVLASRLFPQGFPGQKEKEFFESVKGMTVEWTAVVKSAYTFSSDFVFGNGKGVRCTMELCSVANSFGSKQAVRAVAAFAPEAYDILRSLNGKEIRFRGTLLKFEPFSKEIYLSMGELL